MFLLTNKALIWVGEGQKEKPYNHLDYRAWRAAILKAGNRLFRLKQDRKWDGRLDCFPTIIRFWTAMPSLNSIYPIH